MAKKNKIEEFDNMPELEELEPTLDLIEAEHYDINDINPQKIDIGVDDDQTEMLEETTSESFELEPESIETFDLNEPETNDVENEINIDKDINTIFEKANNNVMQAKNIFNQNIEMKKELDNKFKELDNLKQQFEDKKTADYEKIKNYKDEVYEKVTQKKAEIEEKINELKEFQKKVTSEKERFEEYKKNEINRMKDARKQQKEAFQNKENELDKYKSELDAKQEEIDSIKRQLELDRIKYESDKNELANNLLKFNELVSDFTVNIDKFNN